MSARADTRADRWCTPYYSDLSDYPSFLREKMKREPSFALAREISEHDVANPNIEYENAFRRVLELAEIDREALRNLCARRRLGWSRARGGCDLMLRIRLG